MGLEIAVELTALGLAIWAASRSVPRPPVLNWERLLKTALAVQLLHGKEATPEAELAALLDALAFHPAAGPQPERKLIDPATAPIPVPPLEGERALCEALAKLPALDARWARMYGAGVPEGPALLQDPDQLGEAYHPARVGAGLDWSSVAAWTAPLQQALARRMSAFVLVDLDGDLGSRIAASAPGLRAARVSPAGEPERLAEALLATLSAASDRLILLAPGAAALAALNAVEASLTLRDRLVAVLSLGPLLGESPEDRAWMAEHFTHDRLEPELNRAILYASLIPLDPTLDPAVDALERWAKQRFPVPAPSPAGRRAIDPVDLGPLVLTKEVEALLPRALALFLAFRLST